MSFIQVKNNREIIFKPRITTSNLLYLRDTEIENIKNFQFVELHIDKQKELLAIKLTNQKTEDTFKITLTGKNSHINIKAAMKKLGKKLSSKFYITKINKEKGMYIIDLSGAK